MRPGPAAPVAPRRLWSRLVVLGVVLALAAAGVAFVGRRGAAPAPAVAATSSPPGIRSATPDVASTGSRTMRDCVAAPSRCGFPDAGSTGVPPGTVLQASGPVTADRDGMVIDGLDIHGEVNVSASNVVIRRSRVVLGGGDWVVILRPGAANLRIEDSEIAAPAGEPQDNACVLNIGDGSPTIVRTNIHGCSAGVTSGGGRVEDSYIHDLGETPGLSHVVGIASNGGGGLVVRHTTVINQLGQTAAIALYQDFSRQADVTIDGNLVSGGGYCFYGGTGPKGSTENIRFVDNRLARAAFAKCGAFGTVADFRVTDPGNVWQGNYWDDDLSEATR